MRTTEPGRDPHLHRGVQAPPLRAPQPTAREKTRGRKIIVSYSGKKYHVLHFLHINSNTPYTEYL